jgi:hypothetical protein
MTGFNGRDLASRVAGLLHGQFRGDLVAAARDLDVDPDELRRIVESRTDTPDLNVLAKLVNRFGVDVCWLMTGEYDWRAHMRLLEDEGDQSKDREKQLLLRLTERRENAAAGHIRRLG